MTKARIILYSICSMAPVFQAEGEVMHGVFAVKLLAEMLKFKIHGDFLLSG